MGLARGVWRWDRGRRRAALRRSGRVSLVLAALVILVGVASCRWRVRRDGARSIFEFRGAMAELHWNPRRAGNAPIYKGWRVFAVFPSDRWRVARWRPARGVNAIGGWSYVYLPLWLPAGALLGYGVGATLMGRGRGSREEYCVACGYSLRGLAAPVRCPECGAEAVAIQGAERVRQTS